MKNNIDNVKNLFKKSQKRLSTTLVNALSKPVVEPPVTVATLTPNIYASGSVGLKPRDRLPPVLHSYPHRSIAVLVTKNGLLFRPNVDGEPADDQPTSHVRIPWGHEIVVEECQGDETTSANDWSKAALVHGILGTVKLFACEVL